MSVIPSRVQLVSRRWTASQRIQPQLSGPSGSDPRHDARSFVLLTRSHHHAAHRVDDTSSQHSGGHRRYICQALITNQRPSARHRGSIYCRRLALIASTFLTASRSVSSLCHLFHHQFQSSDARPIPGHSPRKCRVVLLDIEVGEQPSDHSGVPRNERQIRDRHIVPDQILLVREDGVEDPEHPLDLVVVSLDRARNLLRVGLLEPDGLSEVRAGLPPQGSLKSDGQRSTHP